MLSTPVLISMFCVSELLNYEENHENKAPETFGKNRKCPRKTWTLASDWFRRCCVFPGPIAKQSNVKPVQSRITFEFQSSIVLGSW